MKKLYHVPTPGEASGYLISETVFAVDPEGTIWESFEGVWISA